MKRGISPKTGKYACSRELKIHIRNCEESDLPLLEWNGAFTEHRQIIREAFERQQRDENLMLLAHDNQFPVGQIWSDLVRRRENGAGHFWAFRVLPEFQKLGIGKRLLREAEELLERRDFLFAEIGVEKWNERALNIYQHLGYHVFDTIHETYSYETPEGVLEVRHIEEWLLRKQLHRN